MRTIQTPGWMRVTTWGVLFIQFISPLFFALTPVARATEYQDYQNMSETMAGLQALINEPRMLQHSPPSSTSPPKNSNALPELGSTPSGDAEPASIDRWLAPKAAQAGQLLAAGNAGQSSLSAARGISEGMISQHVNDWLNQHGTARVSLGTDRIITGDLLLPLWDRENNLLFSQLGLHSNAERNFANLGFGYRQYTSGWMYGINTFYDYDYTGKNARIGVGGEAWTNYLKLSTNAYYGLTGWHQSPLDSMREYDERPANGFDVRAEGWWPAFPQLGAKLKYERYFGKDIVLAANSNPDALKDDPQALTLGLNYTPFPLLTLSGERSLGDARNTRWDLALNYRFGVPLWQQLDPANVDVQRNLLGSKYDLVDRNYEIAMQYHKQPLVALSMAGSFSAEAGTTLHIPVIISRARYGLKQIEWSASANFTANGGSWRQISLTELEVQIPAYTRSRAQSPSQDYVLTAVGIDENGNRSNPASTTIQVAPSHDVIQQIAVTPGAPQPADNAHAYTINVQAVDKNGQPLVARRINFSVSQLADADGEPGATLFTPNETGSNKLSVYTNEKGMAGVDVRSRVVGDGVITAAMDNGNASSSKISFIGDVASANLANLEVIADNALADGKAFNELRATVSDANGNALANYAVDFSADNGATIVGGNVAMTDKNGNVVLRLTHTRAINSTVTARANNTALSKTVNFLLDRSTAAFADSRATQDALANGIDSNIMSVKVADAHGNPIPGMTIQFAPDSAVNISPAQAFTDDQGIAQSTLTSRKAGTFAVAAKLVETGATVQVNTRFVADGSTVFLTDESLTIAPDGAVANGVATNGVTASVVDANGNPVVGTSVQFAASAGATLNKTDAITGADGNAAVTVTSRHAGVYTVTATANGHTLSKGTLFVPDTATAQITDSNLSTDANSVVANDVATNNVTAVVTDVNGNPLAGMAVNFTVSPGATIGDVQNTTDADGKIMAKVTSLRAGSYTVTAAINGTSASKTINFIGDSATAALSSVTLDDSTVDKTANGSDAFIFKALVKDAYGNVVSGMPVRWEQNSGVAATIDSQTITDDAGIATATLKSTSTEAMNIQVTASLDGSTRIDADNTVNFNAFKVKLSGVIWGKMTSSGNNTLLSGATVKVFSAQGDTQPLYSTVSSNGSYELDIKPGSYYIEAAATEYTPQGETIVVSSSPNNSKNFVLEHRLGGASAFIVLTWDASPMNLDAHLMVPPPASDPNGARLHVNSSDKAPANADASLNRDVINGYGPEQITIKSMHPGSYCYSVHNYRTDLGPTMTGAKVKLSLSDGREYNMAVESASGALTDRLWYVFKIDVDSGGSVNIQPVNRIAPGSTFDFDGC